MSAGRRGDIGAIDLRAPSHEDFSLPQVALGLSRIARWIGQTERPISVIEHSLVVAKHVAPPFRLAALLHDAPEFATGDITRPVRAHFTQSLGRAFAAALAEVEGRILRAVCRRALLDFAPREALAADGLWQAAATLAAECGAPEVDVADEQALWLESGLRAHAPLGALAAARLHYPVDEPAPEALRQKWLDALRAGIEARFRRDGETPSPASSPTAYRRLPTAESRPPTAEGQPPCP